MGIGCMEWLRRVVTCAGGVLLGAVVVGPVQAGAAGATLILFNRPIAELRAPLGGLSPTERAERARRRFSDLVTAELTQPVTAVPVPAGSEEAGWVLHVGQRPMFTLLPADLDPDERLPVREAAELAQRSLSEAIKARTEQRSGKVWLRFVGVLCAAVAIAWVAIALTVRLQQRLDAVAQSTAGLDAASYLRRVGARLGKVACWIAALVVLYGGTVITLEALPWSKPWGERLAGFLLDLGAWLLHGVADAVPGLATVAVVIVVARAVQDTMAVFFEHVQAGRIKVAFLHAETVRATQRLLGLLVWGLALAAAYPYLPGSSSEAFKGLSVLFGLMITLGSTNLVAQLMSGLVLVYSRALRRGDFVAVNGIEGVVSEVGALAVKIKTMRNEEVTLPNGVITSSPIHNYSKLGVEHGALVSTRVTIGYDTAWRLVHAMLGTAARSTPGVRHEPAPVVYQRALSDFYVEYELFAHIDRPLERVAILSALHAAIQDEFNRNGVQIMSPHFYEQPPQPVIVPPQHWHDSQPAASAGRQTDPPKG